MIPYRLLLVPQLRAPWLRLLGARIGRGTILHDVRFFNLYRRGLAGLEIGEDCFLGRRVPARPGRGHPARAPGDARRARARAHPHERRLPRPSAAGALPRPGRPGRDRAGLVHRRERDAFARDRAIGARSFVAAGSVVTADVPPATLVAGVPARAVRTLA